jgi:hypothetical protein
MNRKKVFLLSIFFIFLCHANPNGFDQLHTSLVGLQKQLQQLEDYLKKMAPAPKPEPKPTPVEHESIFQKWLKKVEEEGVEIGNAISNFQKEIHELRTYSIQEIFELAGKFAQAVKPPSPAPSPEPVSGEPAPISTGAPPPPPPPFGEVKPKLGLSQKEFSALNPEQKQKSDAYLVKLIGEVSGKKYKDLNTFRKSLNDVFARLAKERAKNEGFEFSEGNSPEALIKQVNTFIDSKLLPGSMQLAQYLTNVRTNIANNSFQQEMAQQFENWVLADKETFNTKLEPLLKDLIINIAVLVRSEETPAISSINPQSQQAQQSDMQFVSLFKNNLPKEQLIKEINLLRIDPLYLKFMSLQDDIKAVAGPVEGIAKKPVVEKPAIEKEAIEEMLKKLKKSKAEGAEKKEKAAQEEKVETEVQVLAMGIIDVLNQPKGTIKPSQIDVQYLQRYLFDPKRFDVQARESLKTYISPFVVKPVSKVNIVDYFKQVVNQAQSYNDIIEFMKAFEKTNIQDNIPGFTWNKNNLKTKQKYDASALRTLETTLKNAPVKGAGNYQEKINDLITTQRISQPLMIPSELQTQLSTIKGDISKITFDKAENVKKQLNEILKGTVFYDNKLENLPIDDQLFQIIKTIQVASESRRG